MANVNQLFENFKNHFESLSPDQQDEYLDRMGFEFVKIEALPHSSTVTTQKQRGKTVKAGAKFKTKTFVVAAAKGNSTKVAEKSADRIPFGVKKGSRSIVEARSTGRVSMRKRQG